jgi:hypothetical protein
MRTGMKAQNGCEQRFAIQTFTEDYLLCLSCACQLLPDNAIAVYAERCLNQLPYCDQGSMDQFYFFFCVRVIRKQLFFLTSEIRKHFLPTCLVSSWTCHLVLQMNGKSTAAQQPVLPQ